MIEIGPGRGALTEALIRSAGKIAAIEVDRDLAAELRRRFSPDELFLVEADVLRVDLSHVLDGLDPSRGSRLGVVGNLPYNISKPVVQKLIRERAHVDRAVLMFQREVARRLTAAPGGRCYGPLGILAGQAYRIREQFDLPPRAFRPPPKVTSTVTVWNRREDPALDDDTESRLRLCLAVCFARRRRTLRNNLRGALGDGASADRLLRASDLDGELRAEAIPPEGFLRLARNWNS